jgi:hypothetical protein
LYVHTYLLPSVTSALQTCDGRIADADTYDAAWSVDGGQPNPLGHAQV